MGDFVLALIQQGCTDTASVSCHASSVLTEIRYDQLIGGRRCCEPPSDEQVSTNMIGAVLWKNHLD